MDPTANVIGRITHRRLDHRVHRPASIRPPSRTRSPRVPTASSGSPRRAPAASAGSRTGGTITEFTSGLSGADEPADIVTGPDGNLWFTLNADPGGIGRITPAGDVMEFSDDLTMNSRPLGIAAGPDGALWFTESAAPGRIGRITTEGDITEYSNGLLLISTRGSSPPVPTATCGSPGTTCPGSWRGSRCRRSCATWPPTRSTTDSARLRGKVRPNSQATDYYFEYGPSADYGMRPTPPTPAARTTWITCSARSRAFSPRRSTTTAWSPRTTRGSPSVPIASSSRPALERLEPVLPPDEKLEPVEDKQPEPEFGKTVVADGDGTVRYKAPGGDWQDLEPDAELPVGVALDARQGKVNLRTEGCRGGVQAGVFGGGVFSVRQPREACGRVDVYLRGGSFASCGRASHRAGSRTASASRSRKVRRLWGRDSGGRFRSHGRHSHATVRGTRWLTVDRCDGTLTRVTDGVGGRPRLPAPPERAGARGPFLPRAGRAAARPPPRRRVWGLGTLAPDDGALRPQDDRAQMAEDLG